VIEALVVGRHLNPRLADEKNPAQTMHLMKRYLRGDKKPSLGLIIKN